MTLVTGMNGPGVDRTIVMSTFGRFRRLRGQPPEVPAIRFRLGFCAIIFPHGSVFSNRLEKRGVPYDRASVARDPSIPTHQIYKIGPFTPRRRTAFDVLTCGLDPFPTRRGSVRGRGHCFRRGIAWQQRVGCRQN